MERVNRQRRQKLAQLSLTHAEKVCASLGSPALEKDIVLDTYCRGLGERKLLAKHQISRATLTRVRQTFWRRVDSALFVQNILPPNVYDVIIKVFLIISTILKIYKSSSMFIIKIVT